MTEVGVEGKIKEGWKSKRKTRREVHWRKEERKGSGKKNEWGMKGMEKRTLER